MKEVKNINKEARQAYEPVRVKVTSVTPQGILCQSGGVTMGVGLGSYSNGGSY